jgi:hypothetical protein
MLKNETHIFSCLIKVFVATTFCLPNSVAEPNTTMSGYSYEEFKDFEKKWHFVTVRYRADTKEMRFTYANDLAYKTLVSGSNRYPDGARFGKVSIQTQQDLVFPSSRLPSGKVRHTFMVRDSARNKETDGWGYALFDPEGKPYSGDHRTESLACAACHQIVKDTGHVFSKVMALNLNVSPERSWTKHFTFLKTQRKKLPKSIVQNIPTNIKFINLIDGPLRKHIFFGTLDEIRPTLLEEVKKTGQAAGLVSLDEEKFSIAFPLSIEKCPGNKGAKAMHTLPNDKKGFYEIEVCLSDI